MLLPAFAVVSGLVLLVWSADRFVDGSAQTARYFGMPPLLIGMLVVGFGTSAPEMVVSALASVGGNPGIALGNAYGSNITNIALILGLTALIAPIAVQSLILRKELPVLLAVSLFAFWQVLDGDLTRVDALLLILVFLGLLVWSLWQGLRNPDDALGTEVQQELGAVAAPGYPGKAVAWMLIGLLLLILASRILVWGAVEIASALGVSDLLIGLTVVAVGTSLPELASSLIAIRKGEHDIALGNVLGSNLFNTLAVVGIAGLISPLTVPPEILTRDLPVMMALTLSLFVFGYGFRGPGRINRLEGGILLSCFVGYTVFLALTAV
ncbi:cation:H+ antiporter [Marinobacter daqiaonensis]|uniref:Cation:H+ antiporter n=1 Tax=Marinobacter daqiaonensis TaxID=650891 RepID=A0A1I6HFP6_9GAMM|nr:calcium/sodium antiporter [Marinobacter daqiaonensis]SFR53316.1 cation:H+ antiporter [Marinobacter daqiaonensis]